MAKLARIIGRVGLVEAVGRALALRAVRMVDTVALTAEADTAATGVGGPVPRGVDRRITTINRLSFGFIAETSTLYRGIMTDTRHGIVVGS